MNRVLRVLCGLLPLSAGCATPKAKQVKTGDGSVGNEQNGGSVADEWSAAERVARDYFSARDGKAPKKLRRGLARYNFGVQRADGSWQSVLVHRGKVVEAKGLAPLGDHLRDEQLLTRRELSVPEMRDLIDLYGAYPDVPNPQSYVIGPDPAALAPRFEFGADGGATFLLFYPPPPSAHDNMPMPSGGPSGPMPTRRASLAIPPSYALAWTLGDGPPY